MTHFSDAKRRLASSVIRAVLGGGCLKVFPRLPREYLSHAGGWLSQWVDVAFLSGVPEFLLMSVRISHFQLRFVTAILAE
jgi:hypothetical protein